MLKIIQSQSIERLFHEMLAFFDEHPIGVFEPRQILIPSHGVGVWLKLQLASTQGIVAQVSTDFMGAFQWELYGRLAERDAEQKIMNGVPQAPLSASIMRWQIFAYIWQIYSQAFSTQDSLNITNSTKDEAAIHALGFLLKKIVSQQHHSHKPTHQADNDAEVKRTIWVLSSQIAQVFAGYVTYRADWLRLWGHGEFLNLKVLCKDKPEWLIERYAEMQIWQAWLWKTLFKDVFEQREAEVSRFWSALNIDSKSMNPSLVKKLPRSVTIFTVIQLPPAELMFLRQLAQYVDVALLHYNPSQEYWADLVDARWLQRRKSEQGVGVELRETHPLLTRMGKQSRDVFKLLVQLSGGEFVEGESFQGLQALGIQESWQDAFVQDESEQEPTVLQHIQQHALDLSNVKNWNFNPADDSLAIHSCHSTLRQLEVLREEIIQWLGTQVSTGERRKPSDILVLVPDLNDVAPLIRAVFPSVISYDSRAEVHVPIEITGLTSPEVDALWQALTGRFNLLIGRLSCETLLDWLALMPVQQSYGLSVDQVTRIGELLVEAGFRRGFDGEHLSRTLLSHDADVRFTLRFALDRLILGMAMPVDSMYVDCLPMTTLMRDDFELIAVLEQIYQELDAHRGQLLVQRSVTEWLAILRTELQHAFASERDTRGWTSIIQALDDMEKNASSAFLAREQLAKETSAEKDATQHEIQLPLRFVLEELQTTLTQAMQSSIPTGSVTFARLGTMRPLPYRLIAVLNLDTGKFPQREQKNTFDLIGALPPVIGDRARTEDDLGAFLDALLLASEACWLFYNGRDVQDDQPRLPAAPVQELMDFLRDHLAKVPDVHDAAKLISPLDQSIHHWHTLLPFERENFNADAPQAAAGVWFEVAQTLNQEKTAHAEAWISPVTTQGYSVPHAVIKADQWIKDLMQPARYFLAQARIGRLYLEDGLSPFEPLTLNKLDEYQLRHQFQLSRQNQKTLQATQWVAALPVGVAGTAYWKKSVREQSIIEQRMQQYGGVVTLTTERLLTLPDLPSFDDALVSHLAHWQLSIRVPTDQRATMWLGQSASSGKGRHRVRFWLEHLLWQVWRETTHEDVEQGRGQRIVVYSNQTVRAVPVEAGEALKHLQNWLHVWQIATQQPFALPPSLTLDAFSIEKRTGELKVKPFDSLVEKWLGNDFNSPIPPNQNEECALHPDWQFVLQGQDVVKAFEHFFNLYAEILYEPIVRNTVVEDDAVQEKAE